MTQKILDEGPHFLRRADAAKYIREKWGIPMAPRTLAKIACVSSDGPEMHYAGRIPLYTPKSLDAWAVKKIGPPRYSTSDYRTAGAASIA
jgi:hypothetical protein